MKNFRATFCWRNLVKVIKQKKGKPHRFSRGLVHLSILFRWKGSWLSKLLKVSRLVLWTSSLFCERKTMCKTCLKCDFLVDQRPFRRVKSSELFGELLRITSIKISVYMTEVGITCYEAKIKTDFIYSRSPYALTYYKRHYCSDGRTFFSDRSPRSHTVHKAKVLFSIIRLLCMHV